MSRRLAGGVDRTSSGPIFHCSPSFSSHTGNRFHGSSTSRRGMVDGGRGGLSSGAFDEEQRVGGGCQSQCRASPLTSSSSSRLTSTDVVQLRDCQLSLGGGYTTSQFGCQLNQRC